MATESKGKASKNSTSYEKQATLVLDGGIRFKGADKDSVKAGVPHGKGKMVWPSGDYYEGQFKNGKRHGEGRRVNVDGSTFTGQYEDDQPSGNGVYKWADGESYSG